MISRKISNLNVIKSLFNYLNNKNIILTINNTKINTQIVYNNSSDFLLNFKEIESLEFPNTVNINFLIDNIYYSFYVKNYRIFDNLTSLKLPERLSISIKRSLNRFQMDKKSRAYIRLDSCKNSDIVDINTEGLAFLNEKRFDKGFKISDVNIKIDNFFDFNTDCSVKYSIQYNDKSYKTGIKISRLDDVLNNELANYLFEREYKNFKPVNKFKRKELNNLSENSSSININSSYSTKRVYNFFNSIDEQKISKDLIPVIYKKEDRLLSILNAKKLFDFTYFCQSALCPSDTEYNPNIKTESYTYLYEYLLNKNDFKYLISFFDSSMDWHKKLFNNICSIIAEADRISSDLWMLYKSEPSIKDTRANNRYLKHYKIEDTENISKDILKLMSITELEASAWNYIINYNDPNQHLKRKFWIIKKEKKIVALLTAFYIDNKQNPEIYHSARLYLSKNFKAKDNFIKVIYNKLSDFYDLYKSDSFFLWIKAESNNNFISNEPLFDYSKEIFTVILNKEGLAETKNYLNTVYRYYSNNYPLTFQQKSMINLEKLYPGTTINNASGSLRLFEKIDIKLFEKAVNLFIRNNDGIRLRYKDDNNTTLLYKKDYTYKKIDYFDFSNMQSINELYSWEEGITTKPLKIYNSDLYYFAVVKVSNNEFWFYANIHHSITDNWSMGLMIKEITDNYTKLLNNQDIINSGNVSYIRYILDEEKYKYTANFDEDREYWRDKLKTIKDLPELKPVKDNQFIFKSERFSKFLEMGLTAKIKKYCEKKKISEFIFFISIIFLYLYRVYHNKDIIVNTPVFNRSKKYRNTFGLFTHFIPFYFNIKEEYNFENFINDLQTEWKNLIYYQRYPYELIMKDYNEIFNKKFFIPVSFNYRNSTFYSDEKNLNYSVRWNPYKKQKELINFHINNIQKENNFLFNIDYANEFYNKNEIKKIFEILQNLIKNALSNPGIEIKRMDLLNNNEKNKIINIFNNTKTDYPKNKTVSQLFEEQVKINSKKIAIVSKGNALTYHELNEKSDKLFKIIINHKVKPDDIIGIIFDKSINMIIAILAILKAGAAYLPIDPELPEDRINYMINDCNINLLIADKSDHNLNFTGQVININNLNNIKINILKNKISSDNLAYVMYTSGSTGKPKGVLIEHKGIIRLIKNTNFISFDPDDKILLTSAIGFDVTTFEIWAALLNGLTLYIENNNIILDHKKLENYLVTNKISTLWLTASLFNHLSEINPNMFKSLKYLLIGGDKLSPKHINKVIDTNKKLKIINGYGPTENTTFSTTFLIDKKYNKNIPIGRPINNSTAYIFDKNLNLQPIGMAGELLVGGDGLARGYLNRPELNREKFIINPLNDKEKLYRTGDLARWLPDGNIEFLGRMDTQVKIRGHRVEIKEIENNILEYNLINEVAVIAKQDNKHDKYLLAFFTAKEKLEIDKLRIFLKNKIPQYMVPAFFHQLDSFPLNLNGKIDREILKKVNINNEKEIRQAVNPETEIEKKIKTIWEKILKIKNIGLDDNFFDIGGDSLSVIQMTSNTDKYNLSFSIQDLYQNPTIRSLSRKIEGQSKDTKNIRYKIDFVKNKEYKDERIEISGKRHKIKNILLTGSTGFLGSHLLEQILSRNISTLYCIVRGKDINHAKERVQNILDYYFHGKYNLYKDHRIKIINGDIKEKNFGLESKDYKRLVKKIDTVYHSAALVKFFGDYEESKRINVDGTREIIDFCKKSDAKLNYISTLSVSGYGLVEQTEYNPKFDENDFYIGQKYLDNIYVHTKFEAEKLIFDANKDGLKSTIFRIGNITERLSDGKFQIYADDNLNHNLFKSIFQVREIPDFFYDIPLDFTPVDFCAFLIFSLSEIIESNGKTFHLQNPKQLYIDDLMLIFEIYNIKIRKLKNISYEKYISYINKKYFNNNFIKQNFIKDLVLDIQNIVNIKTIVTEQYLQKLNITWPVIDSNYIDHYLNNCNIIN